MNNVTEKIAEFITNTRYVAIPREVIDIAKLHILDTLGCLVAGSCERSGEIVKTYIKAQGVMGGEATLLTQGIATSTTYAAFGKAIIAHVHDYDPYGYRRFPNVLER